jgi:hypothetical protein
MTNYTRPQERECPPSSEPADQPDPPSSGDKCEDIPTSKPPELQPPEKCPEPDCNCPTGPGSTPNCLEDLIAKQAADIAAAKKAEAFKKDLEDLLTKAKAADQEYTRAKYESQVKQWVELDGWIAAFIRKFECALPCWRCVIECYICPILNELHYAERWLDGDGTLPADVHNLYDLQYWHTRDKERKERRFDRIKAVLGAWEKPATTIDKVLNDNRKLLEALDTAPSSAAGGVVVDLFLTLIPMHLAIAPPSGSGWVTKIGKEYTQFCDCDTGKPDNCCGPDVGERTLRQRLIGPQPYLIDPNDYFTLICCLVQKRYGPAKDALGKAEAELSAIEDRIARLKAQISGGLNKDAFEKVAKGAIPSVINCCDFETDKPVAKPTQTPRSPYQDTNHRAR